MVLDYYHTIGRDVVNTTMYDGPHMLQAALQDEDMLALFEQHPDFRRAVKKARNHCVWVTERIRETQPPLCALLDKRADQGLDREETQQAIIMVVKQTKRMDLSLDIVVNLITKLLSSVTASAQAHDLLVIMEALNLDASSD